MSLKYKIPLFQTHIHGPTSHSSNTHTHTEKSVTTTMTKSGISNYLLTPLLESHVVSGSSALILLKKGYFLGMVTRWEIRQWISKRCLKEEAKSRQKGLWIDGLSNKKGSLQTLRATRDRLVTFLSVSILTPSNLFCTIAWVSYLKQKSK